MLGLIGVEWELLGRSYKEDRYFILRWFDIELERIELDRDSDRSEIRNPDEKNRIGLDLGFKESHFFRIRSYF